jgi:uncharacterized protein (TIGR02594 family)
MPRAVDVLRRVAPRARPSYIAAFEWGDALLIAHGITTPARLAHLLAQVLHETGGLEIEWENMSYGARRLLQVFGAGVHSAGITPGEAQALEHRPEAIAERVYGLGNPRKASALGNTQPGDGFRYRGGGLMQTTGRANYRRMGQKCGVDFEAQPDLVLSAEHALKPALCEWTEGRLNAFADCDDILSISRAINLGNPHAPRRPNGMEDRVAWYAKVRPPIDRVEFTAAAGALAPQTIPVQPLPSEKDVVEQSIAAIIADRILHFGDRGSDVETVQRALARVGYGLSGTGHYGANTRAAVADFQARRGLEVDGEVGLQTAKAIDAALTSASEPPKPADGAGMPRQLPEPPRPPAPPTTESSAPFSVALTLAACVGDRILRMGDAGDLVRAVQLALGELGYDLKGSGNYGPNTQSAVADFQARRGLEVDGEVGSQTAKAIDAALASASEPPKPADGAGMPRQLPEPPQPPASAPNDSPGPSSISPTLAARVGDRTLRIGDAGNLVRAVQLALAKLGYDLKGSGNYGANTQSAVTDFQARRGLEVDGEVGSETAKAIDAALSSASAHGKPVDGADTPGPPPTVTPGPLPLAGDPAQPTLAALLGDGALKIGDEGDLVRAFQLALAKLGYDLKGTGTFGGATDTAVTHFQQSRGLEVDGEIGPQTAAEIDAALAGIGGVSAPVVTRLAAGALEVPAGAAGQPIWLLEGLKWMNTRETPGAADNRDILEWASAEGGAIAKSYQSDSIPWCALYANMVLTKVGLQGTETLWALDWSNWGTKLAGPAVGAFAPMKRDGGGHIAIVVGRDQHGNLMCLGGNQSDAVNIKPFPAKRPVSFRWPKEVPPPARTGFDTLPMVSSNGRVSAREA